MTCYNPNYIVSQDIDSSTWVKYKFLDKKGLNKSGWKVNSKKPQLYKFLTSKYQDYFKVDTDTQKLTPVPCGCCVGCRLDYSKQWAARCMLEAEQWKYNYFLTLTYDDDHLPIGKYGNPTLVPDDLKNFIKRLRIEAFRKFGDENIRFFACGEYGDTSFRPHYHLIVFNLPLRDLDPNFVYEENGKTYVTQHVCNGNVYQYSDFIHKLWAKGNILVGDVSFDSCAYVARYICKKQKGNNSEVYNNLGVEPEFCRMSRKPGIAFNYYNENMSEIYNYDNIVVPDTCGARLIIPPRYFDKMLELENSLLYYQVKAEREKASNGKLISIYNNTTLHYDEYLSVLENKKTLQISALCRKI